MSVPFFQNKFPWIIRFLKISHRGYKYEELNLEWTSFDEFWEN